jgi:hypothetical protein
MVSPPLAAIRKKTLVTRFFVGLKTLESTKAVMGRSSVMVRLCTHACTRNCTTLDNVPIVEVLTKI